MHKSSNQVKMPIYPIIVFQVLDPIVERSVSISKQSKFTVSIDNVLPLRAMKQL